MIYITAKQDVFRRGGVVHTAKTTAYKDDHFTKEQIDLFEKEPMLIVIHEKEKRQKD